MRLDHLFFPEINRVLVYGKEDHESTDMRCVCVFFSLIFSAVLPFFAGGHSEKVTPVPIPNTDVKLLSGDDTTLVGK